MRYIATLCKFFQQLREKVYKKPAQFCQYSSVDEAILFGGFIELAGLAAHSNLVHRKLAFETSWTMSTITWINFSHLIQLAIPVCLP